MKFSRDEQEAGICINADSDRAIITVTAYPLYLRKFELLSAKYPEAYKLLGEEQDEEGKVYCRRYSVDKKYIRFGKPASEAKRALGRRLAATR